jgi:hypothetical protein
MPTIQMNCFLQKLLKIHNQMSLDKLLTKMLSNDKDILVPLFDDPIIYRAMDYNMV